MPKAASAIKPFSFHRIDLSDDIWLYIVDVQVITPTLRRFIDRKIGKLTSGDYGGDLDRVKRRILKFLTPKKGTDLEKGAIAELFVHLFLLYRGMQPWFIFSNLEEGSLKKGFDGLYSYNGEEWLCESKSGSLTTKSVSHGGKVKEAYKGLRNKIGGVDSNNPWMNALHHAKFANGGSTLLKKIQLLSDQFEDGTYLEIDQAFIIPCATIYLNGKAEVAASEIEKEVRTVLAGFDYKGIRIICITKASVDAFWAYLKS